MVNKATTAGPLQTHNINHNLTNFCSFPAYLFTSIALHQFPASRRLMTGKYRSFRPLSGQTPIRASLRFLSLFSRPEVLSSPHCRVRLTRGGDVLMRGDTAVTFSRTSSAPRCNTIRLQKSVQRSPVRTLISAHMFHSVLQTLLQRRRSRMQRFRFTPGGSKGRYGE